MEIIKNDNFLITKHKQLYTIEFNYPAYEIINSLIKTRIINGITEDTHKTLKFKASTIKTLEENQEHLKVKYGKINFKAKDLSLMIRTLSLQLEYLLNYESHTILGYNPKDIIVIDDEKFAFLGNELVVKLESEGSEQTIISCPYLNTDFFFSPEMLIIKELPSFIHYKTSYFSLGCLFIYVLTGNDDFYKEYLGDLNQWQKKLLEPLNDHPIKDTKLYWIICRCLKDEPTERSLIFI